MTPISPSQRERLFGPACNTRDHTTYLTPWGLRIRVHGKILLPFRYACEEAAATSSWRPQRIDSYACRPIRGTKDTPSLHGFALADDFFATPLSEGAPPGGVWKPDNTFGDDFARPFLKRGFKWGRYFSRQDWPHLEWADGLPTAEQSKPYKPEEDDVTEQDHQRIAEKIETRTGDIYNLLVKHIDDKVDQRTGDIYNLIKTDLDEIKKKL